MVFKLRLSMYDTEEKIALIIEKEKQFSFDFFIPGYHP